jgi:hypothetical protein
MPAAQPGSKMALGLWTSKFLSKRFHSVRRGLLNQLGVWYIRLQLAA